MERTEILKCIEIITEQLPVLRNMLNLTQRDFASIIGISRQSVIDLEHKNRKITRSVLISIITVFSLKSSTARFLYEKNFYDLEYVVSLGFTNEAMLKLYDWANE
jgi:DNA-binding XRE family transcriptional regulator